MAKPIPAAINVKKLAQKSIRSLTDLSPVVIFGGPPAAKFVSEALGCGGLPAAKDSGLSDPMKADSLPENEHQSVPAILSIHTAACQQILFGISTMHWGQNSHRISERFYLQ